jgi:hypothetical protein
MRAIFIVLVIINLVFFGYQIFIEDSGEVTNKMDAKVDGFSPSNNLQLLVEQKGERKSLTAKQKSKSQQAASVTKESIPSKNSEDLCTLIGPYEKLLHAEYAVDRFAALEVVAEIKMIEIKEGDSFWVYLPPEMSEKEALRRLHELQKKNIESYTISEGELANGISFGRFSDLGQAETKVTEIKNQGYSAEIKVLPKTIQETWVMLDQDAAKKIDESVWGELLAQQQGLEKRQNFCLSVASQ